MAHAIFELEKYRDLPLWAQVLLAARIIGRAVGGLGPQDEQARQIIQRGVAAAIDCALAGDVTRDLAPVLKSSARMPTHTRTHALAVAMEMLIDAAMAAQASESFSAADTACSNSVGKAIESVSHAPGMNPLRTRILISADLNQLRFACDEAKVGTYDPIPKDVLLRLTPVRPIEPDTAPPPPDDPSAGAR